MIEKIKESIWEILLDRAVSLAMIFDEEGEIVWHRGRRLSNSARIVRGGGYCSTPIAEVLNNRKKYRAVDGTVNFVNLEQFESARVIQVQSLVIIPLAGRYFLYIDSGEGNGFMEKDITVFETLASLLGSFIHKMETGKGLPGSFGGSSPKSHVVRGKIAKFALEDEPVLLLGETGVGKSHVAELIHTYSGRPGPFVVVNTPGIPESLLESQLFGHCRGAFSGAVAENCGLAGAADKGTLFFDEIAEISPALQAKLLRFIDKKTYYRVGETREREADIRIVAATNRDLLQSIQDKSFREDLYFRLNCLSITLPPLRERSDDIPCLIEENLGLLRGKRLTPGAIDVLLSYHWPGNVRELFQVLKAAGIQSENREIDAEIRDYLSFTGPAIETESKTDEIWRRISAGSTFWEAVKEPFLRRELNREEVRAVIDRGLERTDGKFSGLLPLFHLRKGEYKNFMGFLYNNGIQSKKDK